MHSVPAFSFVSRPDDVEPCQSRQRWLDAPERIDTASAGKPEGRGAARRQLDLRRVAPGLTGSLHIVVLQRQFGQHPPGIAAQAGILQTQQ